MDTPPILKDMNQLPLSNNMHIHFPNDSFDECDTLNYMCVECHNPFNIIHSTECKKRPYCLENIKLDEINNILNKMTIDCPLTSLKNINPLPLPNSVQKNIFGNVSPLYYMCLQCHEPFTIIHSTECKKCPHCSEDVQLEEIIKLDSPNDYWCRTCQYLVPHNFQECSQCSSNQNIIRIFRDLKFHILSGCLLATRNSPNYLSECEQQKYHKNCAFTLLRNYYCGDNVSDKIIWEALAFIHILFAMLSDALMERVRKTFHVSNTKSDNLIRFTLFLLFGALKKIQEILELLKITDENFKDRDEFWSKYNPYVNLSFCYLKKHILNNKDDVVSEMKSILRIEKMLNDQNITHIYVLLDIFLDLWYNN